MSLGGARNDGGGAFLLDNAVDNLDRANMVVAVAAGNEGPGYFTVHYPGAAPRALTAGASTVGHGIVNIVERRRHRLRGGRRRVRRRSTSDVTAPLKVVPDPRSGFPHGLNLACDDSPPLPDLTGKIALLGRGDVRLHREDAQRPERRRGRRDHGRPRSEEAPFVMSHNGLEPQPTIPGVMVSLSDGASIDDHDGDAATLAGARRLRHDAPRTRT